jgi:transposase
MKIKDARSLSSQAQEALRIRAVQAVLDGMTHVEVAQLFGVARGTVSRWMGLYWSDAEEGLAARRQGRPPAPRLQGHQAATAVKLITDRCPDQLKLPFVLWTREAVAMLIRERFGLDLSLWTVGRYLKRWGLTPQKPARRALEQTPEAVTRWLETESPAIRDHARQEGAEIHWGDEMGLRSDHQAGQTWGWKGQTPIVPKTGQRFRCNVISSVTHRGTLRFRVFEGRFTTDLFIDFLRRLIQSSPSKVFLIVDRHPVHKAKKVARWLAQHTDPIRMFMLPAYSPEINPDEYLNHDVKVNSVGRKRPYSKEDMMASIRTDLFSTQKQPRVVKNFFQAAPVLYAS